MNASCSEGQLLSGSEKERLFVHDVRCPAWAADFRVCVSRETRIPVKTWDLSTWQLFTPKVSRLRHRKSVRVGALLTVDLAVVRSFTDHSRIARPLGQQLQLPLISAPYLSHDVELEVNLEALHREVRRTRLVESTVWHTAQDVLKLIQFLTVK
ncbi:mRNA capping enzyme [Trypanosoma brucei equiperdum]|uniref:mRNA 5'-phosphatase n=1 Tax=Trypanosoma brucei equiperdum TaxID=630700 RepID=A0A3L6L732_9TRYP|nr:mRNA capping enzyme [Trypanosoma brucei equiperdum]